MWVRQEFCRKSWNFLPQAALTTSGIKFLPAFVTGAGSCGFAH